ncbi:DUF1127 domain-containing protein [Bradyrhizobium sp. AUGA SZCCT0431]|uniref:DUF1127 domain-containing protein n=1 Tax=Bradyrhizobium sp. AUGA SZCCT0431 TaxID=2807674 RepID=UPI001BA60EF3|nr:DUF1127 domain-containing protein [Bradyrhizobium sp. AUGA SZCCT0431]MBR1144904.1 DUF1127 domain-containing protein [Bradyrhizobium sp. AUGA SZCCT0431]
MSTLVSERRQPIIAPKLLDRVPAQRSTPRTPATHEPAAAVPAHAVVTPRASWHLILGLIVAIVREWRHRSVARRELASLDERMLRDIGLDPGTVDYEASQSFWRPARDWRN